jgi:hypothetical protein
MPQRKEGERYCNKIRWPRTDYYRVMPRVDAFLKEVLEVCAKYKMSISHEDTGGGFVIEAFEDHYSGQLMDAFVGKSIDPDAEEQ